MGLTGQMVKAWQALSGAGGVEDGAGDGAMEAAAVAAANAAKRKTTPLPAVLGPYRTPAQAMPKPTPANLRKFAETPVPRRAINTIKDRVAGLDWQIRVKRGVVATEETAAQTLVLRRALESPNPADSFRTLIEQTLEDLLVGGFGAIEMEATGDATQPFELWPVDGATIRVNAHWDGNPDQPRYAQTTGKMGKDATVELRDDELMYLRMNPRTHTPFGLGPLEVAFETVNQFLSAHRYAGRLASNSVVQYALWLNDTTPVQQERLIRWWQDEIEGTGRVPLMTCEQKPEVLRFGKGNDEDLRMKWQEFQIRMIGNAFGVPAMMLGLEHDVNRTTASELADEAFRSAVVPAAKLVAEHITRDLFAKKLGLVEFEFSFNDLTSRNELEEVQMQTMLLSAGVLTVDEVRGMRGMGPMSSGLAG